MDAQADMDLVRAADKRADEAAEKEHAPKPKHAWRPEPESWAPAALYNGMVAPAIGYGIKGAIWYQGESNAGATRAPIYDKVFDSVDRGLAPALAGRRFPVFIRATRQL